MVVVLVLIGGLILMLLPQILNFVQSLKNNTNTKKDEGQLVNKIDEIFGPTLVQDSSKLETPGQIAVNNLKSNFTLTPLPNDPIFGPAGFIASISNAIFKSDSSKKKVVLG